MPAGKLVSVSVKMLRRLALIVIVAVASLGATECYKPVTDAGLASRYRTIAVPAFQNQALRYKIESRFTDAVAREIIRRGRGLRVQSETEGADLVIDGLVKRFDVTGVLLDARGRTRVFEITVAAAVTVRDQKANRVLFDNQDYTFRGEYEFANDPRSFFNEEDPAIDRVARSFAESLVSALTDGFGVNDTRGGARR